MRAGVSAGMIIAYFLVHTRQGKLKIATAALCEHEELEEVNEVLGSVDIAKAIFSDMDELQGFIQNKLQIAEGVKDTQTLIVMR